MSKDETGNKTRNPARPVAYDAEGRPLYAAPQPQPEPESRRSQGPRSHVTAAPESYEGQNFDPRIRAQYANEPKVVHAPRAYEPEERAISEELQKRHDQSARRFPGLNLSEGEYVILSIKRHPIGLLLPMISSVALILALLAALISYPMLTGDIDSDAPSMGVMAVILMGLIILIGIGGYIAVWVYVRNTFYLTNESAIQEIQHGIFSRHEQTVSLGSVEDASFVQNGIFPTMLNYGTMRLSTEGEETNYHFAYVSDPKKQVAVVSNAVECFKNGRPVIGDPYEDD